MLAVGVLGPLEVSVDGRPVRLASGRLRALLVVLAMAGGSPLPVDRLATALWDEQLPDHVRRVVQTYLGRLRGALGAESIVTEPAGYRLCIDPEHVDALRFARLLETAVRTPDPATERARLSEALALWRGGPFDGVPSDWLARSEAPRLLERYLAALERRIDLDLAEGQPPGELVAQLQELTARHPLRESLSVRLILTLDRSGRQAEALAHYETIRRRLAAELGTEPGQQLRLLHTQLLTGRRTPSEPEPATGPLTPRQLPADIDGFTGRGHALHTLHTLLRHRDERSSHAVPIAAITGTAGIGKTALAVHWAHQVAHRFPDGQLYLNLRGFHPSGQAMPPAEAIRSLLAALDVPPPHIPTNPDAQIGLYRSRLAGKRILILLDNARDADQVRPLLPGSATCLVLVTSRNQLASLIAAEAAQPLTLDLLPLPEARQLLTHRLGPDRTTAEPTATDQIITHCARLPLALAIAAAHAATRPEFPLTTLAAQLHDRGSRLDTLASGDPTTDARTVFSWSYQALTPHATTLFRQLALTPGPDITAPAAASLTALPTTRTHHLLTELTNAHLLTEHTPGRYTLHDLLRTYATELTHQHDADPDQHTTRHRLLDHYLHSAHRASLQFDSGARRPIAPGTARPGVTPEEFTSHREALAWYATERSVLLAAVGLAVASGFDTHAWQLAWTIDGFLYRQGHWHDQVSAQLSALEALRRLGDRTEEANVHRYLTRAYVQLGQLDDAHIHIGRALDLHRELGDIDGQARTHQHIGWVLSLQGQYAAALEHYQRSLDLYRDLDQWIGEADVLNAIGWIHTKRGDYRSALVHCQRALAIHQERDSRHGEAAALDSIGHAYHHLGRYEQAISYCERALDLARDLGDRHGEAIALTHLGETRLAAGDPGAARTDWRGAVAILDELGRSDADEVRAKLDALESPAR